MGTEYIYNTKGDCIGAIDPIYSKNNTRYSAVVIAKKIKDDHEKEFSLKTEARKYINQQNSINMATSAKKPVKRKRTSATKLCRQVIKVPGINSKTGHLMKGWSYKNGKPVKTVKKTTAQKASPKKGLKAPQKKASTPKQLAARKVFTINVKKAKALVDAGKAKDLKAAWKIIKK